jgi:putative membrane protein insertion efficiency factor
MQQRQLAARRPSPSSIITTRPRRSSRRRRSQALAPLAPVACLRCAVAAAAAAAPARPPQSRSSPLLITASPSLAAAHCRPLLAIPPGQEDNGGGGSGNNKNEDDDDDDDSGRDDPSLDPLARLALAVLRFYRQGISPLLQPACRYQPTCSRYAIASYRAYGGWKGTVLTAWRLMRCAPWGKGGFDPPRWPPVGLGLVFQYDAAAPVAVVLGTAGFVRLVHALLFE